MLNKLKNRKESGFTIIEVMIVLAIAGLIMVVVFLAVPALQRSSRNQARGTDAQNLMSSMSEYVSNNGGKLPSASCTGTACVFVGNAKLGTIDPAKVSFSTTKIASAATAPAADSAVIYASTTCGATPGDRPVETTVTRQYAIWYAIEGTPSTQCISQ